MNVISEVMILIFCVAVIFSLSDHVSATNREENIEIKYKPLTSNEAKEMQEACKGSMPAAEVKVTPSGAVVPENFAKYGDKIRDFEVREDDIWVISYPKSGNTWTQEMVWLLQNDVDITTANSEYLWERFFFLEYKGLCSANNKEPDPLELAKNVPKSKRRYIKTHMPVELLPKDIWKKKPKIIHVSRNPYDVAVSYFYHFQIWNNYAGSKDLFFKTFLKDEVVLSPFWKHVLTYWKMQGEYNNILYIKYEDMKKDLVSVMKKVADFLGVRYPIDIDKEQKLLEHLSFNSMKNNPMDNFGSDIKELHPNDYQNYHYMRKGIVGSWKDEKEFIPFIGDFEKWTKENIEKLKGEDFPQNPLEPEK